MLRLIRKVASLKARLLQRPLSCDRTSLTLTSMRSWEKVIMDIALPKIAQLVADARIELKLLGIDTEGKRSDEILNMAREQRNNSRLARPKPN